MTDFKGLLSRIRFVLVSPSHPGNVGASARAMQAMGMAQMWIADPEDPKIATRADAVALSSGAAQVLGDSRVSTLKEALAPTTWSCALSARVREFEPPRFEIHAACESLASHLAKDPDAQAAFVFGPERSGLSNDQLLLCKNVCSFDVEEKFSSLNLSQSVQIVAFEMRRAARLLNREQFEEGLAAASDGRRLVGNNRETARPASHEAVVALHEHLMRVAISVGYLDPQVPGRFDERLARFLARKDMWEDEVQMLRGLCTAIERRAC